MSQYNKVTESKELEKKGKTYKRQTENVEAKKLSMKITAKTVKNAIDVGDNAKE